RTYRRPENHPFDQTHAHARSLAVRLKTETLRKRREFVTLRKPDCQVLLTRDSRTVKGWRRCYFQIANAQKPAMLGAVTTDPDALPADRIMDTSPCARRESQFIESLHHQHRRGEDTAPYPKRSE